MIPQYFGVFLLIGAGFLGWAGEYGWGWRCFGLAGLITATCAVVNKFSPARTVSQTIQDLTKNKLIDYSVGGVIIAFCAWRYYVLCGQDLSALTNFELAMTMAYWPLAIGLSIHFFANKD